jgi:hypothetical protein
MSVLETPVNFSSSSDELNLTQFFRVGTSQNIKLKVAHEQFAGWEGGPCPRWLGVAAIKRAGTGSTFPTCKLATVRKHQQTL